MFIVHLFIASVHITVRITLFDINSFPASPLRVTKSTRNIHRPATKLRWSITHFHGHFSLDKSKCEYGKVPTLFFMHMHPLYIKPPGVHILYPDCLFLFSTLTVKLHRHLYMHKVFWFFLPDSSSLMKFLIILKWNTK